MVRIINSQENPDYMIPFGDGPDPMYKRRVAKTMIMDMLNPKSIWQTINMPLWVPLIWITEVWSIILKMVFGCINMRCFRR